MNKPRFILILPLLGLFLAIIGLEHLRKMWPYLLTATVILIGLIIWFDFLA